MLFNSYHFLCFFPVVVLLYFAIPQKIRWVWLLICSYYFYMCWSARYVVLLIFATGVTYCAGMLVQYVKTERWKKPILALSICACLSVLFLFKYATFVVNSINGVLAQLHIDVVLPSHDFLLPMGISFYTFQAISYVIDVYRKEIEAEKNPFKYALFISFFPQLVAGPIERSKNLLKQVREEHHFDFLQMRDGLLLMLWGFFLKLVIADRAAVVVDTVYGDYITYSGMFLVVATILFSIQIYCDFAGYSIIAMGAARVMGFELMENFDSPYLARSVAEFWRRWHISLTSWFKDYLYIPLGGNRKGVLRKHVNKVLVFLTSGLWHGAEWSFVVWGGLNGIYQVIGELLMPVREVLKNRFGIQENSVGHKMVKVLITFCLVDFSWIFFRADTMNDAWLIVKSIFTTYNPWILFDQSLYTMGLNRQNVQLLFLAIVILFVADAMKYKGIRVREIVVRQHIVCRWICYLVALFFVVILGWYGFEYGSSFIYFQF